MRNTNKISIRIYIHVNTDLTRVELEREMGVINFGKTVIG